jgi:hypothetical protein
MKFNAFIILALALAGCSSTPTKVDKGPIHARTFSFVNRGGRPVPDYSEKREAIHTIVQDCITRNLAGRGVSKVASSGDVTVGYLLIAGNNASTRSVDDYFGYAENADALVDKAHTAYTSSKNPNYFEAGTLVIDIIDSHNYKLLKRGYATRQILRNPPGEAMAARIQGVVDEILADLRIAP